jgi:hypothetical protein
MHFRHASGVADREIRDRGERHAPEKPDPLRQGRRPGVEPFQKAVAQPAKDRHDQRDGKNAEK